MKLMQLKQGLLYLALVIAVIAQSQYCIAQEVVIPREWVIDKSTVYKNVIIDLNKGSFIVKNKATLQIEHCTINGTISSDNPFIIAVENGTLILKNSKVTISTSNISPHANAMTIYHALHIIKGNVTIDGNEFSIAQPYTAGLLTTDTIATNNVTIRNNYIYQFHGGLLLKNSQYATIVGNKFSHVSLGNIFLIESEHALISKNYILFSGNNSIGDAIDIVDSNQVDIEQNYILSGSCYSIVILRGNNIRINQNSVVGGITYAIYVAPSIDHVTCSNRYLDKDGNKSRTIPVDMNTNIFITNNYIAQNRYGLAIHSVKGLWVQNNIFIQRFADNANRLFWTNNDKLFQNVISVVWKDNWYKEAYSQEEENDNRMAKRIVPFPQHGGVTLA